MQFNLFTFLTSSPWSIPLPSIFLVNVFSNLHNSKSLNLSADSILCIHINLQISLNCCLYSQVLCHWRRQGRGIIDRVEFFSINYSYRRGLEKLLLWNNSVYIIHTHTYCTLKVYITSKICSIQNFLPIFLYFIEILQRFLWKYCQCFEKNFLILQN